MLVTGGSARAGARNTSPWASCRTKLGLAEWTESSALPWSPGSDSSREGEPVGVTSN